MPVYVYKNLATGERFEVEQRITEDAYTEHPESGDPVKRLVQPVGIAFKGSGFYVTDSRGSNGSRGNGANARSNGASGAENGSAKGDASSKDGGTASPSDASVASGSSTSSSGTSSPSGSGSGSSGKTTAD